MFWGGGASLGLVIIARDIVTLHLWMNFEVYNFYIADSVYPFESGICSHTKLGDSSSFTPFPASKSFQSATFKVDNPIRRSSLLQQDAAKFMFLRQETHWVPYLYKQRTGDILRIGMNKILAPYL